jgi:molybdopterin synthase sulfur carrier subunit
MPVVRIPTVLRKHTDGQAKVEASGGTVGQVFDDLTGRHPGLADQLLEGGEVRGFINVYVDDEDIRYQSGLDTPVTDDAEIAIMPAVAGGAEAEPSTHGAMWSAGGAEAEPSTHGAMWSAGGAEAEPSTHGAMWSAGGAEAEPSTHGAMWSAGGAV